MQKRKNPYYRNKTSNHNNTASDKNIHIDKIVNHSKQSIMQWQLPIKGFFREFKSVRIYEPWGKSAPCKIFNILL